MRAPRTVDRYLPLEKMASGLLWLLFAMLAMAEENCNVDTGRSLTVFKSVGFPTRYASDSDCQYTVRRRSDSVCSVTFLFNVVDLEPSSDCSKDYLLLAGEKICGSKPIGFSRTISFKESNQVKMSFHSDNETQGLGYMVTVVQQECPSPSCDAAYGQEDFVVSSPNFPLAYDNGRHCVYTVRKCHPDVCKLLMKVEAFDLEEDKQCESDYLSVGGDKLCGIIAQGQIVTADFPNDTVLMEFQSDHTTTRDGFRLSVHQQLCENGTTEVFSTTTAEQ